MMTLESARNALADAIVRACKEHGRPNSFGCRELEEYGGPPAMLAGRIGRRYSGSLFDALGGREGFGSPPIYRDRKFFV